MQLAHLNWRRAEEKLSDPNTVVVIPVGSTEQHGPIGPLGTDWMIPQWICSQMEKRTDILVTPVIPFGVATHHTSFAGTIDMGLETMIDIMRGVFQNLAKHGAKRFIVINGHGGNDAAIEKAGLELARETGALITLLDWWSIAPELNKAWTTGHGDAQEVSAILHIKPELIDLATCPATTVNNLSEHLQFTHLSAVKFGAAHIKLIRDIQKGIPMGGFGGIDSQNANKEWGKEMMDAVVDYFVAFTEEFRRLPISK